MPQATGGRLIAFRADRLGARLVSLMNAMRIAETVGAEFACAWTKSEGVGEVFNDPTELFDAAFVEAHFVSLDAWPEIRRRAQSLRPSATGSAATVASSLDAGSDLVVENAFGVITMQGEAQEDAVRDFRRQLGRIRFSRSVSGAMKALDTELNGHTAYHIRRGDLTDDTKAMNKPWPHKMVPNEFYETHIRECLEASVGAVLFSDDPATVEHYRTRFPALRTIGEIIDFDDMTEAQRDLMELYAMARCSIIIAPERSAFSSTAADLFGATKLPIADALGADLMDRAHAALVDRIEHQPDSFNGDGDLGQSLHHAGAWLEVQQRWQDAADLFSGSVQAGLNISFIYPQTMRYQLITDDLGGVLKTAESMRRSSTLEAKDFVNAEVLHGFAHIRAGDRMTGLVHVSNAFWHGGIAGLACNAVPLMVDLGWFDHTNFLPVTMLQRAVRQRVGPARSILSELPGLDNLDDVESPSTIGRLDTVTWDWAPLLQPLAGGKPQRARELDKVRDVLEKSKFGPEVRIEVESQLAIFHAFRGDVAQAESQLTKLSHKAPDHWQVWQRLSHVHWLERRFQPSLEAARQALRAFPDAPAMRAWLGMVLLRNKGVEEAVELLRTADAALPGMPGVTYLFAKALDMSRETDEALEVIQRARTLAMGVLEHTLLEAQLFSKLGRQDEAISELLQLVRRRKATGKVFVQLINLLRQTGDVPLATEVAESGAERFPKHSRISELKQELTA